jgi:hypothetical protein
MYIRSSETYNLAEKVVTFAGGTVNDPGDFDGTGNPTTLFTVTGTVYCRLFAVVEVAPVGATATIVVGTAVTAAGLIASTTATNLAIGEIWHDATPDASVELATVATEKIVNQNIIQAVGIANITAGRLRYICLWRPITANATVA